MRVHQEVLEPSKLGMITFTFRSSARFLPGMPGMYRLFGVEYRPRDSVFFLARRLRGRISEIGHAKRGKVCRKKRLVIIQKAVDDCPPQAHVVLDGVEARQEA